VVTAAYPYGRNLGFLDRNADIYSYRHVLSQERLPVTPVLSSNPRIVCQSKIL
jgi:hypothetical protein